jgi:hypothetical protein
MALVFHQWNVLPTLMVTFVAILVVQFHAFIGTQKQTLYAYHDVTNIDELEAKHSA